MLTVRDNELDVGNSKHVLCGGCQRWYMCVRLREITWMSKLVSWLWLPGILGEPCEDIS